MRNLFFILAFCHIFSCKPSPQSKTASKKNNCLSHLKKKIPDNLKDKLYWERPDYGVALGIRFDDTKGTYLEADNLSEASNLEVYIYAKNQDENKRLYQLRPKIFQLIDREDALKIALVDEAHSFEMLVAFPKKNSLLAPNNAILQYFKIGNYQDILKNQPKNQVALQHDILKDNFFAKSTSQKWRHHIQQKIEQNCRQGGSSLCNSLGLNSKGSAAFALFDVLTKENLSSFRKLGIKQTNYLFEGSPVHRLDLTLNSERELYLSDVLTIIGLRTEPEISSMLQSFKNRVSDWIDGKAGALKANEDHVFTITQTIKKKEDNSPYLALQLENTGFLGLAFLRKIVINYDGEKIWASVPSEKTITDLALKNLLSKIEATYHFDTAIQGANFHDFVRRFSNKLLISGEDNPINMNLLIGQQKNQAGRVEDIDLTFTFHADQSYFLSDLGGALFDHTKSIPQGSIEKGEGIDWQLKVPVEGEKASVTLRISDIKASGKKPHQRIITICGVYIPDKALNMELSHPALLELIKLASFTDDEAKVIRRIGNGLSPRIIYTANLDGTTKMTLKTGLRSDYCP